MSKLPKKIFTTLSSDGNFSSLFLNIEEKDFYVKQIHELAQAGSLESYTTNLTSDISVINVEDIDKKSAIVGNFEQLSNISGIEKFIYLDFDLTNIKFVRYGFGNETSYVDTSINYTKEISKILEDLDKDLKENIEFKDNLNSYLNHLVYMNKYNQSLFILYKALKKVLSSYELKKLEKLTKPTIILGPYAQKYYKSRSLINLVTKLFNEFGDLNILLDRYGIYANYLFTSSGDTELYFHLLKYIHKKENFVKVIKLQEGGKEGDFIATLNISDGDIPTKLFGLTGLLLEYEFNNDGNIKIVYENVKRQPLVINNAKGKYYFDFTNSTKTKDINLFKSFLVTEKENNATN